MAKPVTNPRIVKLMELEAAGRIKPEHKQELEVYRARGLAPKADDAGSEQGKAAGFYRRALGANGDFKKAGVGARSVIGAVGSAVSGSMLSNAMSSEGRQMADQAKADFIAATLRYESGAAIPPDEFASQDRIFFPQPGDKPGVIAQKEAARLRAIEGLKDSAGPAARNVEQAATTPAPQSAETPAAAPRTVSATGAATFSTERDKAFAAQATALFKKGGSRADFNRLALEYGAPAFGPDLDRAIANRSKGGDAPQFIAPETGTTGPSVLGAAAATPAGAAVTGVANALTGGTLDEIVGMTGGSQEQAQLAKDVMAADHPLAYTGGEIAGTIGASLGMGALASRAAPALGVGARSLIGDTAYGAIYGAGENNDDRLGGAAIGALTAGGGNLAGQAVVRGAAGAIAPNVSDDVRFLRDNGVRTTLGQSLGETAGRLEEKLVSLPVLGDLIRNGRERALGDFNRGVMNDALGRIGGQIPEGIEGTAAMARGQQLFDDAYDAARSQMQLVPDQQLASEFTDLSDRIANGQLSEASANRLGTIYQAEVARRLSGGPASGDTYKRMSSRLGALRRSTRANDPELSDAIGEMQGLIDAAARRSSPAEAAAAMDAADEGYALWTRVERAAAMRGGDTGTFTPSQLDSAVQRGDGSVRSRSYLRGDAFGQQWADAGKRILRDQVPNSGTADRIAAGGVLAGAGYLEPTTLSAGVLASAAYAPIVRDALGSIVAGQRSAGLNATADVFRNRAYLGGTIGTAGTLDALGRR